MRKYKTQGSELTLERSLYPKAKLFKPKRIPLTMSAYATVAYVVNICVAAQAGLVKR